jgi:hypothetical protein
MPKAKKMGRPKLPKGHAKGVILPVRVNAGDRKLFEKAANASAHKTLSAWIRHTLREAQMDTKEKIWEAAKLALHKTGRSDLRLYDVLGSQDSERWEVKFSDADGKVSTRINTDETRVFQTYKSTSIEAFTQELVKLLLAQTQ